MDSQVMMCLRKAEHSSANHSGFKVFYKKYYSYHQVLYRQVCNNPHLRLIYKKKTKD